MSFQLGQLVEGGTIDAKQAKRKMLDNLVAAGKIDIDEYNRRLEAEGLTDVQMVEHQKAKMKPLLSMGVGGGFGFGVALLAGVFILWKIID